MLSSENNDLITGEQNGFPPQVNIQKKRENRFGKISGNWREFVLNRQIVWRRPIPSNQKSMRPREQSLIGIKYDLMCARWSRQMKLGFRAVCKHPPQ